MTAPALAVAAIPLLLGFLLDTSVPASPQTAAAAPLRVGEQLTYDVSWSGYLVAGSATMTVKDRRQINPTTAVYDLMAEGKPTPLLDRFYHIYYKTESVVAAATLQPSVATMYIDERGHKRLKTTRFVTATSIEFEPGSDAPREKHTVPKNTLDPLSAIYVMRQSPLKVGQVLTMSVLEDATVYNVRWRVSAPEPVKTALGTISCWRLTPAVTDQKGKAVTDHNAIMWISDDGRRLPVKIEAALPVGSFILTLTRATD